MKAVYLCKVWWRVIFDCITLLILGGLLLGVFLARESGFIFMRGFYCEDSSIRLPYRDSTIPNSVLLSVCIILPIILFIGGNLFEKFVSRKSKNNKPFHPCGPGSSKCLVPAWIARCCFQIRWFLVGFLITEVVTLIGKIAVGRLRPNFISVCDPDYSLFNCTDDLGFPNYVLGNFCRGNPASVLESRDSWPSGHSSTSAYSFIFIALYVSSLKTFYGRSAFKLMIMFFSFLLAMLTGLSRITDHKHHPSDVLSGWIIGAAIAFIIVHYNTQYFGQMKPDHGHLDQLSNVGKSETRKSSSGDNRSSL